VMNFCVPSNRIMTRKELAPPHNRCTSSWGWAKTIRPVPISLAGAERAVMRHSYIARPEGD